MRKRAEISKNLRNTKGIDPLSFIEPIATAIIVGRAKAHQDVTFLIGAVYRKR